MTSPQMSDEFAAAFRARLVDHVDQTARPRRHRRTLFGAGIAAVLVLGGTAAAAASGLLTLPGAAEVTGLGAARSDTLTGTGTLHLGPRPAKATGVTLSLTCLTPGTFTFDDGASVTCTTAADSANPTTYVLPLAALAGDAVTVTTSSDAVWSLTASYVSSRATDWAVNDSGETYGVANDRGEPDLIAVIATNGTQGYVRRSDLSDADGTTAAKSFKSPEDALHWQEQNAGTVHLVPVYESDGTTRIGDFQVGG